MPVRFEDVLTSLPAPTQAAIQARFEEIRAAAFDAAVSACIGASYGPPSGWGDDRPRGWHLTEPCSPRDACMHDNGCMDALRRIRARQNADAEKRAAHAAARAVIQKRKNAVGRDADLPATGSFHA